MKSVGKRNYGLWFLLLLLLLLLLSVSLTITACERASASVSPGDSLPAVSGGGAISDGAESTAVTTLPPLTESAETFPPVVYDTSPIDCEKGTPLRLHWNPYLLSPFAKEAGEETEADLLAMIDALLNHRSSVSFSSSQRAEDALDLIFYEFPPSALASFVRQDQQVFITYRLPRQEHLEAISSFGRAVEDAVSASVLAGDSDTVKALLLYRYVSVHVRYFSVMYEPWQTNAFYALTGGKSICYGFADAYNYLLRQVGIPAWMVRGTLRRTGEGHGWSMIDLDGKRYYCDPTWESSVLGGESFFYFGEIREERNRTFDMGKAFLGGGRFACAPPSDPGDERFCDLHGGRIRSSVWSLDRERSCILCQGKTYYFNRLEERP